MWEGVSQVQTSRDYGSDPGKGATLYLVAGTQLSEFLSQAGEFKTLGGWFTNDGERNDLTDEINAIITFFFFF